MGLTQKYLKEILKYDLLTGDFIWRESKGTVKAGAIAGSIWIKSGEKKYMIISVDRKRYRAHRLAFLYVLSAFPEYEVDHIDGNGLNNKWINLRPATSAENSKNMKLQSNNISGHVGVVWHKDNNKWMAQIQINRKHIYLGTFIDINDAIKARKDAEKKYGFHPNHGQDRPDYAAFSINNFRTADSS